MLGKTWWCAIAILTAMSGGVCLGQSKSPAADRKGEEGFRALYTIDRDGSNVRFLAAAPGMISSSSPEWSHNGSFVAFDAVPRIGELGDARLFAYFVEGPFKGMFKELGCGNVPSWSPDGKQIVLAIQHTDAPNPKNRRWGNTRLYSLSGEVPSAPARLERDEKGLMNRSPMWSPDSRALVFSSER